MAFAGAGLTGDDDVVAPADEVETRELEDEVFVDGGLEIPVECFEGLALDESARLDATLDAVLALVRDLAA